MKQDKLETQLKMRFNVLLHFEHKLMDLTGVRSGPMCIGVG